MLMVATFVVDTVIEEVTKGFGFQFQVGAVEGALNLE